MIERIHLAIIREVEQQGSLTAAAEKLFLTQSALSHSIKKLEQQLGTDIWLREGRAQAEYPVEAEAAHVWRVLRHEEKMAAEAPENRVEYAGNLDDDASAFMALTDEGKDKLRKTPRFALALAKVRAKRAEEKARRAAEAAAKAAQSATASQAPAAELSEDEAF